MSRFRVSVTVSRDDDLSKDWSISLEVSRAKDIAPAIRHLSGKKYIKELLEKSK